MSTENKPAAPTSAPKTFPPRVPTITLGKAIDLMRKVWEHEKRNAAPVASILTHWGYAPKSSGGFLAVASMKRFGLVTEEGSNLKRTLQLSPLALELLKTESTDAVEYQRLLKKAALLPPFHSEVWSKYGEEMPSDQTFKSFLVFDKHFDEGAAQTFIRQYKETIAFAKLRSTDKVEEPPKGETEEDSSASEKQADATTKQNPPVVPAGGTKPLITPPKEKIQPPMDSAIRYLPIPLGIGDAPIPVGMSEDDFQLLLDTLQLWKRRIVKAEYPKRAIWHNNDSDQPVTLTGFMGEREGVKYYRSSDGTGIPELELSIIENP